MSKKKETQEPENPQPQAQEQPTQTTQEQLLADVQRLQAEFENYRKRIERDKEQHQQLATEKLIRDLLPVLDNFRLAIEHANADPQGLATGVAMIKEQLWHALSARGVEEIDTQGTFNPQLHEALGTQADPSKENGTIIQTLTHGYTLAGKILQPARVRIVRNAQEHTTNTTHHNQK